MLTAHISILLVIKSRFNHFDTATVVQREIIEINRRVLVEISTIAPTGLTASGLQPMRGEVGKVFEMVDDDLYGI